MYQAGVPSLLRDEKRELRRRLRNFLEHAVTKYGTAVPIADVDHVAYIILHRARRRYTTGAVAIQVAMSRSATEIVHFYFGKQWLPVWQKLEKMLNQFFGVQSQAASALKPIALFSKQRSAEVSHALHSAALQVRS